MSNDVSKRKPSVEELSPKASEGSIDVISYSTAIDDMPQLEKKMSSSIPKKNKKKGRMFSISSILTESTGITQADVKDLLYMEFGLPSKSKEGNSTDKKASDFRNESELILSYVKVPLYLETFMSFGILYSLAVFLKWLIVVPTRFVIYFGYIIKVSFTNGMAEGKKVISGDYPLLIRLKNDSISISLTLITLILLRGLDESKIYHKIKSGTAVKLYFMVGLLEIADKLLSAAGQDIMQLLYGADILTYERAKNDSKPSNVTVKRIALLKFLFAGMLAVFYLSCHSIIFVYQVMALNVAVNSYSNALLTLILSSQFSELKSSVFKRIEREGLFQLSCADLNERFMLLVMLSIISSRNLLQMYGNRTSETSIFDSLKPNSWYSDLTFSKSLNNWIGFLVGPSFVVIGSELLVDWLKHSYITKFNRIRARIYLRYLRILSKDYIADFKANEMNYPASRSHGKPFPEILLRRTGLPVFTIVAMFYKMAILPWFDYFMISTKSFMGITFTLLLLLFLVALFVSLRILLVFGLLKWSSQINQKKHTSSASQDYFPGNPNVTLADASDVRDEFYSHGEKIPDSLEEKRKKRVASATDKLSSVTRFKMADKKIW